MTYVVAFYISLKISESIMTEIKDVARTFLTGKLSATLVIPIEIARRNGLEETDTCNR